VASIGASMARRMRSGTFVVRYNKEVASCHEVSYWKYEFGGLLKQLFEEIAVTIDVSGQIEWRAGGETLGELVSRRSSASTIFR